MKKKMNFLSMQPEMCLWANIDGEFMLKVIKNESLLFFFLWGFLCANILLTHMPTPIFASKNVINFDNDAYMTNIFT